MVLNSIDLNPFTQFNLSTVWHGGPKEVMIFFKTSSLLSPLENGYGCLHVFEQTITLSIKDA